MECKFCNHPLEEGSTLCPNCGKDNAAEEMTIQEPAEETVMMEEPAAGTAEAIEETAAEEISAETEPTEIKEGIKMTPGKLTLLIVSVVVLTAVVLALILQGMGLIGGNAQGENTPEETVTATVPADGNPDDVTCKGSYSVSDEEAAAAKDTVVATMGDIALTNAELQVYYWMQVQMYLSEYGSYASYIGLDYTQPLDTQMCGMTETPVTWQQFFLEGALSNWNHYQALASESLAKGFAINDEVRAQLDNMPETLAEQVKTLGFASVEEYLAYNVGPGCDVEDYLKYLELYYQGYAYFEDLYTQFQPTEAELEAFFAEHKEGYAESGITEDSKFVDVRHILIMPDGADSSNIRTETFPDEAWEIAKTQAEELLQQWQEGEATEESFAQLANTHSADGDGVSGGLYTQVVEGQMVKNFEDWCFDESRAYGDVEIVETEFGYHIMFFVSATPQWKYYAESDYISERVSATVLEVAEANPYEVDYSAIKLGVVELN